MTKRRKPKSHLWLFFSFVSTAAIIVSFSAAALVWMILYNMGKISFSPETIKLPLWFIIAAGIFTGFALSVMIGKLFIHPVQELRQALFKISKGDFAVRLNTKSPLKEISQMNESFNSMTKELENIETLRNDFVANVSHEIKTPISAISGYASLLSSPALTEEKRKNYTEIIEQNAQRLSTLTGELLLLSRLDNQCEPLSDSRFRLDEMIRNQILLLEGKWSAKNILWEPELEPISFNGKENLLCRMWTNILDNAIKASAVGGTIRVSLTKQDNGVRVTVRDFGKGMSGETQKHIFDKFYQGDRSRGSEGNGLGLCIVKKICELHHGEISVVSRLDEGSSFNVFLPFMDI